MKITIRILQQTKRFQEEVENFFVKRVILKAGIPTH